MTTADDLQRWRTEEVGLTYRELAELTGHHLRTWQKWCLGALPLPTDITILVDHVDRVTRARKAS